ncbi:MAG TPA: carboxypeptidase regulatory-like domain-containing protein [Bryobacteraceae bacterium]|nr:carboxypeptidase regulatory-like domain-containing protein [Bryobacteraceae bacterium]
MKHFRLILLTALCLAARAQDPTGTLEGQIADPSGAAVTKADVSAQNAQTGFAATQRSASDGSFHFSYLPVGDYELRVSAQGFAAFTASAVRVDINRTVRLPVRLDVAAGHSEVNVTASGATIDIGPTLGNVVSSREAADLPLNGRNFTQLGLLQPGVAPMTGGLAEAGGLVRANQAYAVNGQRPESNGYLLDGVSNLDNVNGGFAIRVPVDAIGEFRILTLNAPAEYGGTSGATTSAVTKSGGNDFHGDVYEFLRNNDLDARNFFASSVEPLHRNQFGATLGGPIRRNKDFFFAYYEGLRDRTGVTKTAIVPTPEQREGNFSGTGAPLLGFNFQTGGFDPVPGNQLPPALINPIAKNALQYYPLGNLSPSLYTATVMGTNNYDQGGFRLDHNFSNGDQLFLRYATSSTGQVDPLPIAGAGVPGFPVGDSIRTHSVTISDTHLFSPGTLQTFRAAFFRNEFIFGQRLNSTPPSALGFQYQPTLGLAAGPPYLIVSGYASVGDPIVGPQNTYQNNYQVSDSFSLTRGRHSLKLGGEFTRTQLNLLFGIATNGFFVFAPFPFSDPFASFLTGQPVVFFQGGGQFDRALRNIMVAGYAQDEWRVTPRLTINYGLRYEINTPYVDIRDRMNEWAPGVQSRVYPNAPPGLLFPGDPGVARSVAPNYYKALMPRIGIAWDPTGSGHTTIRAGYGIFYDSFTNGVGGPLQAPVSALPWTLAYQLAGPGFDIANPYGNQPPPFASGSFVKPATVLTVDQLMRPPYAQNWNISVERVLGRNYLLDVRYVGNKGTRLPRMIEADPSVYGPGVTPDNIDQNRVHAGCPATGGPCNFASVGLVTNISNSTYHSGQISLSRHFATGLGFQLSYWFSKSLDDVSSFNVSGSAPSDVSGENDLAQNPFNIRAEHGPSLFDARQRLALSGSYQLPHWRSAPRTAALLINGWQFNGIASVSTGTPFTVYDSANVALQGQAPEISGFYSSRPDLISNPNDGPHTPNQWVSPSAFQRLNPATQAGQFGNEGRNVVRGPGIADVDLSLFKSFAIGESKRIQFRAECFNIANHANFGLPQNDIASPEFGQILEAGSPRLFQLALKFLF